MDSYSLQAVLSVSDKGFTNKMSGAVKSMEDLDEGGQNATASIKDIASGIGVFKLLSKAADVLVSSLGNAISRFDTLNQYPKVMQNLGYTAEDASASLDKLSAGITGLPTALDDAATYTKQWALATGDLELATDLYLAINDGAIAYGASAEQAASCQEQLNQMISTGSYDLQSWKIINQNCPGLLDSVARSMMGESSSAEMLRSSLNDGAISTEQFERTMISLDQNGTESITAFSVAAQSATGGIGTSVTNMKTAVVRGMENIIRSTNDALENSGLPGYEEMIQNTTSGINTAFSISGEAIEKFVKVAAPGVKLVTNNLDVLVPVLGTATAGFVSFKAAMEIQKKATDFKKAIVEAADTIKTLESAEKLAAKATVLNQKATEAAADAELWSTKARKYEKQALEAQIKAKELSTVATKARTKADKAGALAADLQTAANEAEAAAAEAQAYADNKSVMASKAKSVAEAKETAATSLNTAAEEANAAVQQSNTIAAQISNIAIAAKTALLAVLSGEYGVATSAALAFGAAVKANPIGAAIIAITALIAVIVAVTKAVQKYCKNHETLSYRQKKSKEATEELTDSLEESKEAYEDSYKEAKNSAGAVVLLAKKTIELAENENRSAADTELLKSNVEQLNDSIDGLNLAYDDETKKLNISTEALERKAEAYKQQALAEVYAERYKEILEEQLDVEDKLAESEALLNEIQEKYRTSMQSTGMVTTAYTMQLAEQQKVTEELTAQKESLEAEEQKLTDKIANCQLEQAAATQEATEIVSESVGAQKINMEQLSDTQEDTLERIVEAYETMTGSLSSLNDTIEEDHELTWEKVQKNQEDTIKKTQEFADLYQQAIDEGISESYLNAIGATGPEAIPLLEGMLSDSIDTVKASQDEWEDAYDTISSSFVDSMNLSDEDKATIRSYISSEAGVYGTLQSAIEACDWTYITDAAMKGITEGFANSPQIGIAGQTIMNGVTGSLQSAQENADFAGIGKDGADGYTQGWADTSNTVAAVTNVVKSGIEAAKAAQNSNSPSKVYRDLGEDAIDGYALGLEGKENFLNSTMKQIMNSAGKTASTALNDSLKGMTLTSSSAFMKISTAAKTGMQKTSSEITGGMQRSNAAMQSGMNMMYSTASSRIQMIQMLMNAGMKKFTQIISSGMNSARVKTISGSNNIAAVVEKLDDKFYNSGYYASVGLAKGIRAGSGQAIAAANRLANSVHSTINAALKIHSPSRVTRESGGFTAEGMALGMLDKLSMVQKASDKIAMAAVPTGEISRMATSAGKYVVDTSQTYAGDVNATYSFAIPVMIDGREFAKATATYTQEEFYRLETRSNRKSGKR